ncbi:hypothetical protein AVEN_10939-1, partial [Araneus ventricosus]
MGQTLSRWCGVEGVPTQVSSSSSDYGSKLQGPSQNSPRVASKQDINITNLNRTTMSLSSFKLVGKLSDNIAKQDLTSLPHPTPTRYGNYSASFIDLTITKNFLYPYDLSSDPEMSSDHNPIIINFYFNYHTPKPDKITKTIRKNFIYELCNLSTHPITKIHTEDDLDKNVLSLTTEIINSFHNNSKEIDPNTAHTNSKLRDTHTLRNKARRN